MEENNRYTYWKRPWARWMLLLASALEFVVLFLNVREYQEVSAAAGVIFTSGGWEKYAASQQLRCALNGILGGFFLGVFLIGTFCKSARAAHFWEGVLQLTVGLSYFAADWLTQGSAGKFSCILLVLSVVFGAHSFYQSKKKTSSQE